MAALLLMQAGRSGSSYRGYAGDPYYGSSDPFDAVPSESFGSTVAAMVSDPAEACILAFCGVMIVALLGALAYIAWGAFTGAI